MQYGQNNGAGPQQWSTNSYYPPRPPSFINNHYGQGVAEWQSQHTVSPLQHSMNAYPRHYDPPCTFDQPSHPRTYDNMLPPCPPYPSRDHGFDETVNPSFEPRDDDSNLNNWNSYSNNHQGTYYPNNERPFWSLQASHQGRIETSWEPYSDDRNCRIYDPLTRGRQDVHQNNDVDYRRQERRGVSDFQPIPSPSPVSSPRQNPPKNRFFIQDVEDEDLRVHSRAPRDRSRSPIQQLFPSNPHSSISYEHTYPSTSFPSANHPRFRVTNPEQVVVKKPILAAASSQRISSETLLAPPGRRSRQPKILILRGLPGSGKSTVARLIKEKETQMAIADKQQPACRLVSIDDFYMTEDEEAKPGAPPKYVYDASMEEVYKRQLVKLAARQMDSDLFNLLIVDSVNQRIAEVDELAAQARPRGFQVYVLEITANLSTCIARSQGRRSREDILYLHKNWEPTSSRYTIIDANSLQQEASVEEIEMESDSDVEEEQKPPEPVKALSPSKHEDKEDDDDDDDDSNDRSCWGLVKSKWDKEENFRRLERLDGLNRKMTHSTSSEELSMAAYLQAEDSKFRERKSGVKRVTWADLEALRSNSRRRDIGFVIGQKNWSHLTQESEEKAASEALVRTKYF